MPIASVIDFPLSAKSTKWLRKELAQHRQIIETSRAREKVISAELFRRGGGVYSEERLLHRAYRRQQDSATERGIAWELSYESWLQIWQDSGHLQEGGRRRGRWAMERIDDQGAYVVGNVKIILCGKNNTTAVYRANLRRSMLS